MATTDVKPDPAKVGLWEPPFPIENCAVHATLLPDKKILCWGRRSNPMSMINETMSEHKTLPFLLDVESHAGWARWNRGHPTELLPP